MKSLKILLVIALLMIAGTFSFFIYRMGTNDAKALADFQTAYSNYNQAIADFSSAVLSPDPVGAANIDDLESKANQALVILNSKASVRISSLTKNDGELMKVSLEIAALAAEEFDTLLAYQSASFDNSISLDQLSTQFHDLDNQRQAAYAQYLELAQIK